VPIQRQIAKLFAMKSYDAAVIGAGIIGTSCAFALADSGLRVALFDSQTPGREATWAAGGMLSPAPYLPGDENLAPLANESLSLYPDFVRSIESASGRSTNYNCCGAIEIFFGAEGPGKRDHHADKCRRLGIPVEAISATEARHREPAIASNARTAAFFPTEGTVEPRALIDAALEAARMRGVEVHPNAAVDSLLIRGNRCREIISAGERCAAGHVVVAAGCFSQQLFENDSPAMQRLAQFVPTRPVRGQMIAMMPRDTTLNHAVRSSRGYLVPRSSGTIVAGSTLEEAGFDRSTTTDGLQKIRKAAIELVPGLADAEIVESWSGLRPGTPDGLPILGPVDIDGLIFATGHFRNGILLAPATAHLVKTWITGAPQSFPAHRYSPLRFARAAQAQSAC
jgi:glycine oxidase